MSNAANLLATEKLTKKFLMSLPEGAYLVSNVCDAPGQPAFADIVATRNEREQQWSLIKAAWVDGRLCDVFRTRSDHDDFRDAFPSRGTERRPNDKSIRLLEALLEESPKPKSAKP